jgi:hypothetical protein
MHTISMSEKIQSEAQYKDPKDLGIFYIVWIERKTIVFEKIPS